jgi:DNA modification methylase
MTIYWWHASSKALLNLLAWEQSGFRLSQIVIWPKKPTLSALGLIYHHAHEPCLVGWKKAGKHYQNNQFRKFSTVDNLDRDTFEELLDFWYIERDKDYVHPTQKPVRLAERALKRSTLSGDAVIDCFAGSGSTLIACEQMDRPCFLMEFDPKFCEVIIKRFEEFTGAKAKKL